MSVGIKFTNPISNSSGSIITIGSKASSAIPYFIDELAFIGSDMDDERFKNLYNYQVSGAASTVITIKDGASATYDMQKTYGSTSSAKVALAIIDKESPEPLAANVILRSDKIQLYTNETIYTVAALLTGSIDRAEGFPASHVNRYVDGYAVMNGDKILFSPTASIESGSAGIYIASISNSNILSYPTSGSISFNENLVFFVANGDQYGDIYCSADKVSGSLSLNVFDDRFKIKFNTNN
ncbi:hypothetical protein EBR43_13755 [bacterium]|nr:hypothetical protein [bacterium]